MLLSRPIEPYDAFYIHPKFMNFDISLLSVPEQKEFHAATSKDDNRLLQIRSLCTLEYAAVNYGISAHDYGVKKPYGIKVPKTHYERWNMLHKLISDDKYLRRMDRTVDESGSYYHQYGVSLNIDNIEKSMVGIETKYTSYSIL